MLMASRNAETLLGQGVQMIQYFAAHAHVPGARQISGRDKRVTVMLPLDQLMLTLESQPLAPGSWLADALADVTAAMDNIDYRDGFAASLESVLSAIRAAIPVLEKQVTEPDASVDEIVADLERALLISLVVALTAHREGEWMNEHQRFLNGFRSTDLGHYLAVRTLSFVDEPGPGRVHMQHVVSACDAGMTSFVAGASQGNVEHHPEILAVIYAEWFTYIFAIWEEQFHGRLASFWDAKLDDKIRRSDILVDYFGDIRLIPEISTEEMISLIELFPYDELLGRRPLSCQLGSRAFREGSTRTCWKTSKTGPANSASLLGQRLGRGCVLFMA
jgi:hypothetical protein